MNKARRCLLGVLVTGVASLAAGCQAPGSARNAPRDGVFVHITRGADDPHAVLMGLKMATLMAADRDVLVYFDLKGVEVVLADAPDLRYDGFESSRVQLRTLLDRGVPVLVCPGCLRAAGRTAEDVLPRVQVADKERFFSFTRGRILTLDY